jgi:hypothetical protein
MKRLCIFYDSPNRKTALDWLGKPVQWIICKKCQKLLAKGISLYSSLFEPFSKYAE